MANTTTKNILLSQSKIGQSEGVFVPTLTHSSTQNDTATEVKVEVPGVDPATVHVGFENNALQVQCEKGELTLPVGPTVDVSKIKADILWGILTLLIPLPEPPAARTIKVSVHDGGPAKKQSVSKADGE